MDGSWDVWDRAVVDDYLGSIDIGLPHAVHPVVAQRLGDVAGKVVLDYGCGDGRFARTIEGNGAARVIGVDVSPDMIAAARRHDPSSRVEYHVVPHDRLTVLADACVDAAVANYVFMMAPTSAHIAQSLRELHRVVKPTGAFVYSITHPAFVDRRAFDYRNDFGEGGFDYLAEGRKYRFIGRAPDGREIETDWFDYHYTLATYLNATIDAGFAVARLDEVAYPDDVARRFAIPRPFLTFPHALVVTARRSRRSAAPNDGNGAAESTSDPAALRVDYAGSGSRPGPLVRRRGR
jgi:SAM-dependent methyltransferase